jgi:hypothetical protein
MKSREWRGFTMRRRDNSMSTETSTSRKPTHRVFAVVQREGRKNHWNEIGAAWAQKDGKGFSIRLNYLPLNGADIVIRVAEDKQGDAA